MLVLSRKSQESVVIGGSEGVEPTIKVTVLEIGGKWVRLGFEAGADVSVHRWEVWERIRGNGEHDSPNGVQTAADAESAVEPSPDGTTAAVLRARGSAHAGPPNEPGGKRVAGR